MSLKKSYFLMFLGSVLIGSSLYAKIPQVLNFSGYLGAQNAEISGDHSITITIWDDPTANDTSHMLWTETYNIHVEQGRFHVLLGTDPNNPLPPDIFNKGDLYIEVRVDNEAPMKPRMKIVSVPYALNAQNAKTLDGKTADTFATVDYLNSELDTKADKNHNHDDRYYTKQQVDQALNKKINVDQKDSITGNMVKDGTLSCSDFGDCGCGDGQLLKWNHQAGHWTCADDTNTDTLGALKCTSGQVAKYNGSAWECAADKVNQYSGKDFALSMQACDGNKKVTGIDENGHVMCAPDQDNDTLGAMNCKSGQVARFDGTSWKCSNIDYSAGKGIQLSNRTFSLKDEYLNGSAYDSRFVNVGEKNSISRDMIRNGAVDDSKISSVSWSKIKDIPPEVTEPKGNTLFFFSTPVIVQFSFSNHQRFVVNLPSSIPNGTKAILADVFITVNKNDHNNFVLGSNCLSDQKNWVNNRGQKPSTQFGSIARHCVTLTYPGEADGFTSNYGLWYSSQIIPVRSDKKLTFNNYSNSNSSGWVFIRIRGYFK